jgi:hypothetical protein
MLAAIDFHALGQVVWVSAVAGIGVTVLFSLAIFYFGKAGEARRSGHAQFAVAFGTLAILALVVFAVAVVVGVTVMLKKS